MEFVVDLAMDMAVILVLLAGIGQFRNPPGARRGNWTAAAALALALGIVLWRHPVLSPWAPLAAVAAGGAIGIAIAFRVNMIQIPAMVAFQHGAGGIAAFLVSFVELYRDHASVSVLGRASGMIGLAIGAATFSGSLVASGKLSGMLGGKPTRFAFQRGLVVLCGLAAAVACGVAWSSSEWQLGALLAGAGILAAIMGLLFSVRIGGADMPVLISFLNATAGLAAAFCGIAIENRLLIACGAVVAASGSILTHIMCKAMHRSLFSVLVGTAATTQQKPAQAAPAPGHRHGKPAAATATPLDRAVAAAKAAKRVIFVPGYGMAVAQAQFEVVNLAKQLEADGKEVLFAIHPVAGRMPGHMNVLLAEAEVDYGLLKEMDEVNPLFPETDLAIVVGACDVVNPAAIRTEDTPISGMPILNVHEAKNVAIFNFDPKPGYSGVLNPLYDDPRAILVFGDAKTTVADFSAGLAGMAPPLVAARTRPEGLAGSSTERAALAARAAKRVVFVPGYGMAVAQAQFEVVKLSKQLEAEGKEVLFAIHPVAGRMPGHMNVLLAEAEVDYGLLKEMDEVNPLLPETDLVIVVGACDVVNPAAIRSEGTPISGMPILNVHEAKNFAVCNLDEKPGYSGVANPLYEDDRAILLFGDAKATVAAIREAMAG